MNDHELRDEYERALGAKDRAGQPSALPLDRLESLVAREGAEADRLRALDIAMSTAEGRLEFEVAWAASRAVQSPKQQRRPVAWMAAAAALFLAASTGGYLLYNRSTGAVGPGSNLEVMRGTNTGVTLVMPRGELPDAARAQFAWRTVPSAQRYLMVVVDQKGNEVFASTTRDTAVTLPDSIKLQSGGVYLWWVQTELADGTTATAVSETIKVKNGAR